MCIFPNRYRACRSAVLALLLAIVVAGCASDPAPRSPTAATASPVVGLLEYADTLATSDPATRENAVRQMRRAVRARPDAKSYARLSIALGAPRQRLYTPDEAARYARKAMAAGDGRWDRVSRRFLAMQARQLDAISRALKSQAADHASNDRAAKAHIARLERELAEARAKIAALSNIERQLGSSEADR